jgi:tetratricopeptide (TPR) repeat protein
VASSAHFEEARMLAVRGSVEDALAALDAVLAAEPTHVPALLLKAGLLLGARDGEAAAALYRRAVDAAPRSAEAWNGLARCLHAQGLDVEALEAAETARGLLGEGDNFREVAPVYLTIVWCLREQRRFRDALAAADEGLARCPDGILAQWASLVEEELAEAEKEEC